MNKLSIVRTTLVLAALGLAAGAPVGRLSTQALAASTPTLAAPDSDLRQVFADSGPADWVPGAGGFTLASDPALGSSALTAPDHAPLTLAGQVYYTGDREVRAWVRLHGGPGPVIFTVARRRAAQTGSMVLAPVESNLGMKIQDSPFQPDCVTASAFRDGVENPFNAEPSRRDMGFVRPIFNDFTYRLHDQVSHGTAELPSVADKWLAVRIELRKGLARFWLDDHLVAWRHDPAINPDGAMTITLGPGAQLADFRTTPPVAQAGYLPLRLGGYANGREFMHSQVVPPREASSPNPIIHVGGVPFVWTGPNPQGLDHLDIGRCPSRQPGAGAQASENQLRDPAQIQLRIPNANYDTLYLLAAADDRTNDRPDRSPTVAAIFHRPMSGAAQAFTANVSSANDTTPGQSMPWPVELKDGLTKNLWLVKIPLDPGRLSSLSDLDVVELELTSAGPPSSVHVYGVTLARSPIDFDWQPDAFGHVWQAPAQISYTATIVNHSPNIQTGRLTVTTRSYDGKETTEWEKPVTLDLANSPWPKPVQMTVPLQVKRFGYHEVTATLEIAGRTWTEKRALVQLRPGTPTPPGTPVAGAIFDYLSPSGATRDDGGTGALQRPIPYCDPKPAYAAGAAMADQLNGTAFSGWVKTGSPSTYCMCFQKPGEEGYVYTLWTLDTPRQVTLTLDRDSSFFSSASVLATDSMDNTTEVPIQHKRVTVTADRSVLYITFPKGKGRIAAITVGEPIPGNDKTTAHGDALANVPTN